MGFFIGFSVEVLLDDLDDLDSGRDSELTDEGHPSQNQLQAFFLQGIPVFWMLNPWSSARLSDSTW